MSKVLKTAAMLLVFATSVVSANQVPGATKRAVSSKDEELRRLTDSVLTVMERERLIVRAIRDQATRPAADSTQRVQRRHYKELQAVNVQKMRLQSRLSAWCNQSQPAEGWMGIAFSGDMVTKAPLTVRFDGYPRVDSVEPDSPAKRAGLQIGDTILSLDGDDLLDEVVAFASLLRPGTQLSATVRREGRTIPLRMQITRRPAYEENRCGEVNSAIAAAMANPVIDVIRIDGSYAFVTPPGPNSPMFSARPPRAPQQASAPEAVVAPMPPRIWVNTGSSSRLLAGMEVVLTEREVLNDIFGAPHGVFVSRALQGSPAYNSGIRAGDIIISAAGQKILSPISLEKAMADADDSGELKLVVVRKRAQKTIYLRWGAGRD